MYTLDFNSDRKFAMIEAMKNHGGSFVKSLGSCFMRADYSNFNKLCIAFPEYVKQYLEIADKDAALKGGDVN